MSEYLTDDEIAIVMLNIAFNQETFTEKDAVKVCDFIVEARTMVLMAKKILTGDIGVSVINDEISFTTKHNIEDLKKILKIAKTMKDKEEQSNDTHNSRKRKDPAGCAVRHESDGEGVRSTRRSNSSIQRDPEV